MIKESLKYCLDCKMYHSQMSRKVKVKGFTIGEICDDCNKARIQKLLSKNIESSQYQNEI